MSPASQAVAVLHGGLGNQLFQLAAALSVTPSFNPEDVRLVSYGSEWGPQHPDVSHMAGIAIEYPGRLMRSTMPGVAVRESWKDDVSRVLARIWAKASAIDHIHQTDPFGRRITPREESRTIVLDGFFQNPEWWLPSWRRVAELIHARRPDGVDQLQGENRTAIKLRRSDYLGRGIVLSDDYYRNALDRLDIRECQVVVVCEDSDYLPHFEGLLAERGCWSKMPEPITGNPNVDDFWHLAAARRQILANSSYCWWAAAVAEASVSWEQGMPGGRSEVSTAYPIPWLPNSWSEGSIPEMGISSWLAVPAEFS